MSHQMELVMRYKEIPLTQDKVTLVDIENYDYLNQWKWFADKDRKNSIFYAKRSVLKNGKQTTLKMHREILKPPKDMEIDHKNRDGLDNRKCNLRLCNRSQNQMNKEIQRNNTSSYKGVSWHERGKKWQAYIRKDYKRKHLGLFNIKEEAALAYNEAAIKSFGEFARLNILK